MTKIKRIIKRVLQNKYPLGFLSGFLFASLVLQLIPTLAIKTKISTITAKRTPAPTVDPKIKELEQIVKSVIPAQYNLGISFKDTITKLVEVGAIDKDKFIGLYQTRGGLSEEDKKLLNEPSDKEIVINQDNQPVLLNLLWALGITNKTNVLSLGPIGTQYKDKVGQFASTGGWTLGKFPGGELFNKYSILPLTSQQEDLVKEIAQNIYRPCCGNSTYFPDCNHGAAMLAFVELAVSQGMPKDEIYKKALVINSYWFPQTYADLAVYFKAKKNISWNQVDPKEVLGQNYSSGQGYKAVNQQLQAEGLLPKVQGGGGCGV